MLDAYDWYIIKPQVIDKKTLKFRHYRPLPDWLINQTEDLKVTRMTDFNNENMGCVIWGIAKNNGWKESQLSSKQQEVDFEGEKDALAEWNIKENEIFSPIKTSNKNVTWK